MFSENIRLALAQNGELGAGVEGEQPGRGVSPDGLVIGPWSLVYKAHTDSEEL